MTIPNVLHIMKYLYLLLFVFMVSLVSFYPVSEDKISLEGSWELVSYIDHDNNGTEWEKFESNILIQKFYTYH